MRRLGALEMSCEVCSQNAKIFLVLFGVFVRDVVLACGGEWNSSSQNLTITSPNYPAAFPINTLCSYKFRLLDNQPAGGVSIVFEDFHINDDVTAVDKNSLSVVDSSGTVLGNYTSTAPAGVTSQSKEITVTFRSSGKSSTTKLGFEAFFQSFNASSSERFEFNHWQTSGYVASPLYPLNYPNGIKKEYYIVTANKKGTIKFNFQGFDLGPGAVLKIFEEDSKLLPLYTFTNAHPPKGFYYTSLNRFWLDFVTSSNQPTHRGFNLTFVEYCVFEIDEIPCYLAHDKDKSKHTIILGSALGFLAILVILIALICYACRKLKKKRESSLSMTTQFQHHRF